jgi:lipoprotein-anchoring transpeptidase ErfK/SrfK
MNKIPLTIISLCAILLNTAPHWVDNSFFKEEPKNNLVRTSTIIDFRNLRDTLYTSKNYFIEVNLNTQHATLYSREGWTLKIPVSTGNEKVEEGIETRQGLFVVQWKAKEWHSVQFDSTLMLRWMGFNGGIGFHALEGKSYYKYLGKKNVSHGCVRLSREDAEKLFEIIDRGTPVLVHKEKSAITIAFTNESENYSTPKKAELKANLANNLSNLYNGEYFTKPKHKIAIDETNIISDGIMIGDASLIPSKQNIIPPYLWLSPETPESELISSLLDGNNSGLLTLNSSADSKISPLKI